MIAKKNDNRSSYKDDRGFTLIELMITVAIVAILAAIALPSYREYIVRGKRTAAKSAMMDIANREQQYLLANRTYADTAALTANGYALPSEAGENYTWTVDVPDPALAGSPQPSFLITLTPTGSQATDVQLTLNSQGIKTPSEKWAR